MARKSLGPKAKKRRKKRRIIFAVEVFVLLILCGVLFVVAKFDKFGGGDGNFFKKLADTNDFDNELMEGYTTFALFGLDSRDGSLESGARTDTIMIASINNETSEIKLLSVYRDTYLKQGQDTYTKANAAYASGGPEAAINMLNENLDMDIKDYVAIDFSAMTDVVDLLGGIDIEITEEERQHINHNNKETSKVTGVKTTDVTSAGLVHLDGVQATSYARIRKTEGDDYRRTERQREVMEKILQKSKESSISTLNNIVDEVFENVSTSLTSMEILKMAANVMSYELGETSGFPFDKTTKNMGASGDCVIPEGLAQNVEQLHAFLFGGETYVQSSTVQQIGETISEKTGVYAPVKNETDTTEEE